ncbi:YdiK family protein [Halobacillus salinarum]|uniref:YdiK family protein n=1 Tax=Halobacillus salinarum TaxID=2932257 RepID=A0ABY4EKE1_9BACI|nr:YdiK family protein [Halobacillus salinarum]UOQ44328.1 YdiK family protein [Halobacillus salinarum]
MRISPLYMAFIYFGLALGFMYIAAQAGHETIWNVTTLLLAAVATFNIAVAIRLLQLYIRIQKSMK